MNRTKRLLFSMLTLLCCCTGVWAQSASDVLSGVFTINANGVKVQFSKGNLQKIGSNYQFAEDQYDYFKNDQSAEHCDLFAGLSVTFPDDGISWRIMSKDEWEYLLTERSVNNTLSTGARYSKATIVGEYNEYKGVIVFPDNYTHPEGTGFSGSCNNATQNYSSTVSLVGWKQMEAAGCIFLPAAGYASSGNGYSNPNYDNACIYKSSTQYESNSLATPGFYNNKIALGDSSYAGTKVPVRLVQVWIDPNVANLQQDAEGYYLIGSVDDWKGFAAIVYNEINTAAKARMTADIDLGDDQTTIGTGNIYYQGTFDGQGHTLTVAYSVTSSSSQHVAPFIKIKNATIQNLHVSGSITTAGMRPASITSYVSGTCYVRNCWSDVAITSSYNADICAGGLVTRIDTDQTLHMDDCIFTGSITLSNNSGYRAGGLIGWTQNNGIAKVTNCLFAPSALSTIKSSDDNKMLVSGYQGKVTITNCYYNEVGASASPSWVVQGTAATDAELADGTTTTALNNGRSEVIWVQDAVTNMPMLAIFANAVMLTDETDLTAALSAYAGKTCKVAYSRSFTNGAASTVCVPFAYQTNMAAGTFYTFTGITHEGSNYEATMTEYTGDNLVANTPYLFKPSATGSVDFSGTYTLPASITAGSTESGDWTYLGTYETISWTEAPTGIYGFSAQAVEEQGISQGEFVKVGAYVRIKPMRCYLEYTGSDSQWAGARGMTRAADEELPETIKVRLIGADGEVTAIGSLQTKTGEVTFDKDAWYSLDGRRIEGKPSAKGIYVNNGKKVIIK